MGYITGIGPGLLGNKEATEPCVYCDFCGKTRFVYKNNGEPYGWFLKGKNALGWFGGRLKNRSARLDICMECATKMVAIKKTAMRANAEKEKEKENTET